MDNYYPNLESDYEASASSKPINLKLIFSDDEVNSPVFTKQKITGKNGGNESLKVILVDADTQQEVTTGPVASATVKIVLVHGNYHGATTMEDGDFERSVVVNWGKKKNLLQGDVDLNLKHGTGTVGELRIQHDKNPIKNVEFRLAAMVVDCPYEVKQAITQPFKVKDRRNAPKSFRSLSLTDEVWQLNNIRRYGVIHKRLEGINVCIIKDFLNMYQFNRQKLQKVYGVRGKKWEATVNHAKTCNVANENDSYGGKKMIVNDNLSINDYYSTPKPYENGSYGKEMINVDDNISINDYYTPKPYASDAHSKEMINVDDNISINDYYTPKPYENDSYGKEMINVDDNISINDYYIPKPYENGFYGKDMMVDGNFLIDDCYSYGEKMIVDDNFSIDDVEANCDTDVMWFPNIGSLPCQDGICGTSGMEEKGVKAKKRWMKMRTLLFSIASFMCGRDMVPPE